MVDHGNERERPPAVVMGLGPGGLGVVRSLARLGVEVHGVYLAGGTEIGRHTRLLSRRWPIRPQATDARIVAALGEIRRRASPRQRMALFPANDRFALLTAKHRADLENDFILRVPPKGIETAFLDKRAAVDICRRHGIAIPRSCVPHTRADVDRDAGRFEFPVIIKPALQEDPDFPGKNVVASDRGELIDFYDQHPGLVPRTMFQEMVPSGDGHILGVNTYSGADGRVLAWTSHRRLRQWLPDRGATTFGVTETHTSLRESTVRFLDALGYVGFAGVEYAEDARTGHCTFLELNARVVLPNRLFADAGVDLTEVGYLEMCGLPTPRHLVQRDGVYWIDFHRDLASSLVSWRRGRLGLREWLRDLRKVGSEATFTTADPKPFAASLAVLASVVTGQVKGSQSGSLRSTGKPGRSR